MTVNTQRYGKITAKKDTILSLIIMLCEARDHYEEIGCNALADDARILIDDLRAEYYGPDDFEI